MEQEMAHKMPKKAGEPSRTIADITPLEPPVHSFSSSADGAETPSQGKLAGETLPSIVEMRSPPVTPHLPHVGTITADVQMVDPPLFSEASPGDRSTAPLFEQYTSPVTAEVAKARTEANERAVSAVRSPREPHYPAILGVKTTEDALDFFHHCIAEQKRWRALPKPALSSKGSRRDAMDTQQLSRLNKSGGVTKPRKVSAGPAPKPAVATPSPPPRKASAAPRRRATKPKATSETPSDSPAGPKKYHRAPPSKKIPPQPWREIEDVSPPISTLDGKTYDANWTCNPLNISEAKDLEHLHPLEQKWASKLRLLPAQYLTAKRNIFLEKVKFLKMDQPKNFSKTAAQNVVQMDVNKASRLHMAFDAVGWFDEAHFQQYL